MEEIAAYTESQEPLVPATSCTVGTPLLARFSADGVWYRAEVQTPQDSDGKLQVLFVDYGNAELVSAVDTLPIPGKFTTLCKQAATYRIGSATGTMYEEWPQEAFGKFEELAQASKCLTATILETREDSVVVSLKSEGCLDFPRALFN